jgi:hypothetical protein
MTPLSLLVLVVSIPLSAVLCILFYIGFYRWARETSVPKRVLVLSAVLSMAMSVVLLGFGALVAISPIATSAPALITILYAILYVLPPLVIAGTLYLMGRVKSYLGGALIGGSAAVGVAIISNITYFLTWLPDYQPTTLGAAITDWIIGYGVGLVFTFNFVQFTAGAIVGSGFGRAARSTAATRRIFWIGLSTLGALALMGGYLVLVLYVIALWPRVVAALAFALSGLAMITASTRTAQLTEANARIEQEKQRVESLVHGVIPLGVALSEEKDFGRLLDRILDEAQKFTRADGATLYLRTAEDRLDYVMIRNQSLNIRLGGEGEADPDFDPLPLDGDQKHVVVSTVQSAQSVNISDIYAPTAYDLSGPRDFDAKRGYRTRSILCLPLKDASQQVIGALQLINARDTPSGEPVPFTAETQQIVESLAMLAAAAMVSYLRNQRLRLQAKPFDIAVHEEAVSAQVDEIVGSEFFSELQAHVAQIRNRKKQLAAGTAPA